MGGVQSSIMGSYRAIDCYTESCKLLIQRSVHLQFKHKTSRNQKRKQVITEVLLFATFCSLHLERRGQLQGWPGKHLSADLEFLCATFSRTSPYPKAMLANYTTEHAGGSGKGTPLQTMGAASSCILLFCYIYYLKLTFLMWTNWRISMSSSLFLTSGRTVWTTWQTTGTMISLQESDRDSLYRSCWSSAIMWLWLADL